MAFQETDSKDFLSLLKSKIDSSFSLLDVGSGLGLHLNSYVCNFILALDVHRPYLENRKNKLPHIVPVHADAMKLNQLFLPRTISTVLLSDSVEHFSKKDGLQLLKMAEEIANERVVVFTPRGFFPQTDFDFFELQGGKYQGHKSGWEVEEFLELGFDVTLLKGFHDTSNPSFVKFLGSGHPPVDAIFACKDV